MSSPPLQNRTGHFHGIQLLESPDPLARTALLTRGASALSFPGSTSRLIPPARMTPASLGLSTATCSPLFRGDRPHVSLSKAFPSAFASLGTLFKRPSSCRSSGSPLSPLTLSALRGFVGSDQSSWSSWLRLEAGLGYQGVGAFGEERRLEIPGTTCWALVNPGNSR